MSGTYIFPLKRIFLNLSGGTVSGNTVFSQGVYANIITGETYYSGVTLLENIIYNIASSFSSSTAFIQPGSNITTGGSGSITSISVIASPSFNNIISSGISQLNTSTVVNISGGTISAGTIYSAGTNLYDIFATSAGANDITRVQPGLNIYTGGTANEPTINISAATLSSLSATTISGGTLYSGNTNLYDIFATAAGLGDITRVQPGLNTYTGGTANAPTINISAATLSSLSATTISGGTLYSGSTNLYSIFSTTDTNDVTRVQPGSNITTGGTGNLPSISIVASPSFNGLTSTGTAIFNQVSVLEISGTTFFSGSTNLQNIFLMDQDVLIGGYF